MESISQALVVFTQQHLSDIIQLSNTNDLLYLSGGVILVILVMLLVAYFTVKRIVIHLVTGYLALYVAQMLGVHVEPDALMITLMALFGPIPVILAAGWHFLF